LVPADVAADAVVTPCAVSADPHMRGIGGSSSGAIAAFMVAWERPDEFHKVLSNVGSFTDIRGAAPEIPTVIFALGIESSL